MDTYVFAILFDALADAQAFIDKVNADLYNSQDNWDIPRKHPDRDQWAVTYNPRIDHLLDGMQPVELSCDWLPDACFIMDPLPEPEPEPEPPPIPPEG